MVKIKDISYFANHISPDAITNPFADISSTRRSAYVKNYKRDDKGNLIEIKSDANYHATYSDYEFDEEGNWIKRKAKIKDARKIERLSIEYRVIIYY